MQLRHKAVSKCQSATLTEKYANMSALKPLARYLEMSLTNRAVRQ